MADNHALSVTPIPTSWVGPLRISGNVINEEISVPLATYETPLWPSVGRGARVSRQVEAGIQVTVVEALMARSSYFTATDAATAVASAQAIKARQADLAELVAGQSRFARLIGIHDEVVGNLLFLRFSFTTGDASGHNMVTKAAELLMATILDWHPELSYGSISGNVCMDKKPSAVNGLLGRGKRVIAEILIPAAQVEAGLKTSAARVAALNTGKNLVGSTIAGSLRSANAHYANMLLAFYLATGQDAANIVEGSQGITYAEDRAGDLYFSCSLPNVIVGTVGNGKDLEVVEAAMVRLGCRVERGYGENAQRLAALAAATVLCGELSLLAAQTNPGELMQAHERLERGGRV